MMAVAPQNRGDNMGRYSVAGSGLDCKSSGFTSPGSSPGRLTTVVSTVQYRYSGNQSGPGVQYVSPWDNKIAEETTAPQLADWPRGVKSDEIPTLWEETLPPIKVVLTRFETGNAVYTGVVTALVQRPILTDEVEG